MRFCLCAVSIFKKAENILEKEKLAGVASDLNFLWVDKEKREGESAKKYQRVIVEDIGWRRAAQTKKSREIISLPVLWEQAGRRGEVD